MEARTRIYQTLKKRSVRVSREHAHPLPPNEVYHSQGVVHILGHQHVGVAYLLPIPPGFSRSRPRRRCRWRKRAVSRLIVSIAEPPVTTVPWRRRHCRHRFARPGEKLRVPLLILAQQNRFRNTPVVVVAVGRG